MTKAWGFSDEVIDDIMFPLWNMQLLECELNSENGVPFWKTDLLGECELRMCEIPQNSNIFETVLLQTGEEILWNSNPGPEIPKVIQWGSYFEGSCDVGSIEGDCDSLHFKPQWTLRQWEADCSCIF